MRIRLVLVIVIVMFALACGSSAPSVSPVPINTTRAEPTQVVQVHVGQVTVLTETVVVSFTVSAGTGAQVLFDTPVLEGEYPTSDSMEAARFALLDLVTGGQAEASLEFPRPVAEPPWLLVFNPLHGATDYVAPRVEVEVGTERRE